MPREMLEEKLLKSWKSPNSLLANCFWSLLQKAREKKSNLGTKKLLLKIYKNMTFLKLKLHFFQPEAKLQNNGSLEQRKKL